MNRLPLSYDRLHNKKKNKTEKKSEKKLPLFTSNSAMEYTPSHDLIAPFTPTLTVTLKVRDRRTNQPRPFHHVTSPLFVGMGGARSRGEI